MKTDIAVSRTKSIAPFYFINVYSKDNLGFVLAQSSFIIDKGQYEKLKGDKEEIEKGEIFFFEIGN